MLLPIKPVCSRTKMRKDGTSIIFIQYCYDSQKRTLLNTGIAIPPKYWLRKRLSISSEMPNDFGYPDQLNEKLKHQIRKAEDIVSLAIRKKNDDPIRLLNEFFGHDIDISEIEIKLKEKELAVFLIDPRLNLDVYFQIDDYIKSKSQKVSPGMLRIYRNMKEHLQRNLFVLGCLTGLRFSDFFTIQPSDVRNGMLYKKQGKSDGWVVIPLRKEALSLFNNEFKEKIPVLTNAEFNRHIKKLGKLAGITELIKFSYKKGHKDVIEVKPKCEWITSHTCRRSFCTNEFSAGTPVELIMKISGHKSVKDFYRYIRISPEEAGQKSKEIWQQRGEMELFGKLNGEAI